MEARPSRKPPRWLDNPDRRPSHAARIPPQTRASASGPRCTFDRPSRNLARIASRGRRDSRRHWAVRRPRRKIPRPYGILGCTPIRPQKSSDKHSEAPRSPRTTDRRCDTPSRIPIRHRNGSGAHCSAFRQAEPGCWRRRWRCKVVTSTTVCEIEFRVSMSYSPTAGAVLASIVRCEHSLLSASATLGARHGPTSCPARYRPSSSSHVFSDLRRADGALPQAHRSKRCGQFNAVGD